MAYPSWDTIPLLALRCIMEYVDEKDALAAASTCRHWRSSLLMYDGRRNVLRLPVDNLEKSNYLVRLFKKHARRLHIQIDGTLSDTCSFMRFILPQFLDSLHLQEIVFIGPLCRDTNHLMPYAQLRRIITETLVYKHAHVLERFALLGCEMNIIDENDRYVNDQMEYYSKPLSFQSAKPFSNSIRENAILSRCNVEMMMFSNLKHIVFEYELLSTEALVTLSKLDNFKVLSLNFLPETSHSSSLATMRIDWAAVKPMFSKGLEVAVNLIYLQEERLNQVLEYALCSTMPVTSIKALFLQNFYMDLIMLATRKYSSTLAEFVWADPPTPLDGLYQREIPTGMGMAAPYTHVNPFIYLSWQCTRLEKLVIHGYWMCEYDLLGVTRLRPGLDLVVSSIYDSTTCLFEHPPAVIGSSLLRVMANDTAPTKMTVNRHIYMNRLNELQTRQLTPKSWKNLPEALKLDAANSKRTEYIVSEVLQPWGVT